MNKSSMPLRPAFAAGASFQQALEQIDGCETMALLVRYWTLLEMERALGNFSQHLSVTREGADRTNDIGEFDQ
jgi:hypothetical protein